MHAKPLAAFGRGWLSGAGPFYRLANVGRPRVYLSHDADADWLSALEFGVTDDGQPSDNWHPILDEFGYLLDAPVEGRCLGFVVTGFSEFDLESDEAEPIWRGPRFDVPSLGLRDATAGEIVLAARTSFEGQSTVNRLLFQRARDAGDKYEAAAAWAWCLQAGDVMAHYGLGYTLYDLGDYRRAYRHLRAYTEITPTNAWAWCWLGKACEAIGETAEAVAAYQRAVELEDDGEETEAPDLLRALEARGGS